MSQYKIFFSRSLNKNKLICVLIHFVRKICFSICSEDASSPPEEALVCQWSIVASSDLIFLLWCFASSQRQM